MAKPTYYEMLRDPQWQKKRLEIMQRDEFCCQRCENTTNTLNVHHSYYEKGKSPWEYPAWSLHTLCKDCHEVIQEQLTELHRAIGLLAFEQIEEVTGYAKGLAVMDCSANDTPPICALTSSHDVDGFVRAIMTHNGPGAQRPFNNASNRLILFLQENECECGFVDGFYSCYPELIPAETAK